MTPNGRARRTGRLECARMGRTCTRAMRIQVEAMRSQMSAPCGVGRRAGGTVERSPASLSVLIERLTSAGREGNF